MRRHRRGGFSLGELFLAMSIIIVGGGVVIANCHRGYRSARAAACTSNVKQLAIAMRMYGTDYDRPPPDPRDFGALMVYIKNQQVLVCPAHRQREGSPDPGPSGSGEPSHLRTDYLLNPQARLDDAPQTVIVGDDVPARHMGRYWIGARLDGACFVWPASEWQSRLGGVTTDAPPPMP